ncbi:hypothetical protein MHC_01050 [Mycoplasma haemocanis str. Illinois]|uniref:Uncharacterized protein n=1 Tax=Mycoplasma haemocanis (strain Illinois) TaxID=1111676 RepID=H6N604_MYCHN|nr:hypothetical protein [Mycoplasma haemocanis]AEW45076.1 hypothetical protein MHC_01050 [Mycoplasma haemocanis str. Illinois]
MLKLSAGLLGVGTVAAGGVLVYKGLSKPLTYSIKDLLAVENPEKRLISKSSDGSSAEWKEAWKLYLSSYKKDGKNPFFLSKDKPNTEPDGKENAPAEFMNKCEEFSRDMVVDKKDNRYQNVLDYCTRNTLIQDLIQELGRTLLKESGDDWSVGWESYRKANAGRQQSQDIWKLSDWSNAQNSSSPVSEDFKKKCKDKLESSVGAKVDDDYQNVVNWCSKPKKQ